MVYLCEGEHWSVPGRRSSVHATREGAVSKAVELVNIMVGDHNDGLVDEEKDEALPAATVDTWEDTINTIQDIHGAAHCYVEVTEEQVRP
jgi:hypothetical protein